VTVRRSPSYIPAKTFALTILDTIAPEVAKTDAAKGSQPSHDAVAALSGVIDNIGFAPVKHTLEEAVAEGRTSIAELRTAVEERFDELMDRTSGWYKRRSQKVIAIIAIVVATAFNLDTFHMGDRLARDDALRASVVQKATAKTAGDQPQDAADQIDRIGQLGLPIGWGDANRPDSFWGWVGKPFGIAATALAVMLGAPFWFDALGKLARLRGVGNREGTAKSGTRAAEDRDDPSARRTA
jgi:hypothetical protein